MDKKGAINLSINMIIVLIIAIVVLGFALSFITGMFRKVEVGLEEQFPTLDVPVSRDSPIGIGDDFLIRDKEVRKIALKVFNPTANPLDVSTANSAFECSGSAGPTTTPEVTNMETKTIDPGATAMIKTVITGGTGMENNAICTLSLGATGEVSQSFFLNTK